MATFINIDEIIHMIQKDESNICKAGSIITEKILLDKGFSKKVNSKLYNLEGQTFFVHEIRDNFSLIIKENGTGNYCLVIESSNPDGFAYEPLGYVRELDKILEAVKN